MYKCAVVLNGFTSIPVLWNNPGCNYFDIFNEKTVKENKYFIGIGVLHDRRLLKEMKKDTYDVL